MAFRNVARIFARGLNEINCLRKFRTLLTRTNNLMAQISYDTYFTQTPLLLSSSIADNMDARQISLKSTYRRYRMHAREQIALGRCFKCQHEAGFLSSSHAYVSNLYASIYARVYVHNLQSLEILLVVPWKMYDALLLKASKRKFQCLDISPCVRPYGYTLVPLHSGIPWHPRNPIQTGRWV